jgi:hypothetical protein
MHQDDACYAPYGNGIKLQAFGALRDEQAVTIIQQTQDQTPCDCDGTQSWHWNEKVGTVSVVACVIMMEYQYRRLCPPDLSNVACASEAMGAYAFNLATSTK